VAPIPVYIGYDEKETIAFWVAAHSITSRSSIPVAIIPLRRELLSGTFDRPRAELDSTDFSNSRWIVPNLQGYKGWAVFVDCDVLFQADIADLWAQRDDQHDVMVKMHNHVPRETTKFLGATQTQYERKNWSSLMLMNCDKCTALTRRVVNTSPGLWLHQMRWADAIGAIEGSWNLLVGYDKSVPNPQMVHFTSGGPWHGYNDIPYATRWWNEYNAMIQGGNPVNYLELHNGPDPIQERHQDQQ